ncbi:MAG TPA: ATP-binding protein [Candidatus Binataceae bacterium]|nr:ATP-binding protein [Candidatus Binataceae bacterium]
MPYEEYFKAASEGLIVVDRQGRILEANPQAEQLFGYTQEELLGQPVELLVPTQNRELHHRHVGDYFSAPRTRVMGRGLSLAARRKDGSEFPVEISLTYARGTARGDLVVAAVTDISERLALEHEARRAETITSLGTLAAGIAHDLNNPLQVIRSRSELLLESPGTTPASEMNEDLDAIHRQAERAGQIVEGFLELSRQREKVVAPVNINELINAVLLLIGDQLRKVDIDVQTNLDRNLPPIVGHAIALERVLINLLSNARDAMPQGGAVLITSGLLDGRPGWLHLTVADTGPGIPADSLDKVFNLLYTTKVSGSGLGLWLSQRIVNEHQGRIEVHSNPGKGTTFKITLPTQDSSES